MLITLDFETFWDKDFTLTKYSTSEYVRNPLFETLSCSIKVDDNAPFCYFGFDEIKKALARIKWGDTVLLCHHTQFDGLILSHVFGHVPARYADTLSMGRALHPKGQSNSLEEIAIHYGKTNKLVMPDFRGLRAKDLTPEIKKEMAAYNNGDVQSTYEIYQEMLKGFPVTELDLIDITVRMFADPILRVDMALAKEELRAEKARKDKAIEDSGQDIDILSSNPKFVKALEALGVDIPMKPSPSIKDKMIPAVAKSDEALQALLLHPIPEIAKLVEGRLAAKSTIGESRALRMIERGKNRMRLPIYLNYAGAHTYRWSGGDKFNPQNFKQSQKEGGKLREAIIAPPGHVLIVVDSSQIEARLVAWLAGCEHDLQAYRDKRDLYCEFATKAYGRTITKSDKEERFVGKTCKLGLGFNMGGPKLQVSLLTQSVAQGLDPVRLPLEICYKLVNTYRSDSPEMPALWKYMNDYGIGAMLSGTPLTYKCVTFKKGKIDLPNGLSLLYPGLSANLVQKGGGKFFKETMQQGVHDATYKSGRGRSKLYGGLLTENIVQALARIIVADAMREIAEKYRIVLMTHDEIVFSAPINKKYTTAGDMRLPQDQWHPALVWALDIMRKPPAWAPDLPLDAEGGWDVCYSK